MPTHDALNERLSEYLDNELDAAERAAVEAHLAECGECRTDLQALAAVVARAGTLTDAPPDQNLWPGVEAQIAPPQVLRPSVARRRFAFTMPQLIAASLALMVASGGMVWLARLGGARTDFPVVLGEVASPSGRRTSATPRSTRRSRTCSRRWTRDAAGSMRRRSGFSRPTSRPSTAPSRSAAKRSLPIRERVLEQLSRANEEAEARTAAARHGAGRSVGDVGRRIGRV